MTRSDVIEQAQELTERRGERVLNMNVLYAQGLQKFLREKRFWWRRKTLSFTSQAGVALYDLSSSANGLPGATDLEEIITVIRYTGPNDFLELDPLFEPINQEIARLDATPATDEPSKFMIEPDTYQTLRLYNQPNGALQYVVPYWAIPNPPVDDTSDVIPLVPGYLHYALVDRLRRDIHLFLFGMESDKFKASDAEYQASLAQAEEKPAYSVRKAVELRSSEKAVRSSGR